MADTFKTLGQIDSAVTTLETLYTVPGATSTVVSSIVVCNRSGTVDAIRIAVQVGGAAIDNKHYIYYDLPLPGNDTFVLTGGITLAATDVVSVYSATGNTTFSLFGMEVT